MKNDFHKHRLLLGAHMSIAGGVDKAILRGHNLGCTAIQMFLKYNTRWEGKPLMPEEQEAFLANRKEMGMSHCIAHNCYLINLASPDETIYHQSLSAMRDEMDRSSRLRIPFLVIHPGSHKGSGEGEGIKKIASSLNLLLEKSGESGVMILLETTAGQGTGIGYRFEHLAEILNRIKQQNRIGVCLDTAHIFAAGYDIRTRRAYRSTLEEFDRVIGLERIRAIHLNDSQKPLGSRVDRHEHIGRGFIGVEAFRCLMNEERFFNVPKILETPKGVDRKFDRRNLRILKGLVKDNKKPRGRIYHAGGHAL